MNELERFMLKVEVLESGCWRWTAATGKGYSRMNVEGRVIEMHRWSYEQFVGPIPEGLHLDHTCHTDDPSCPGGQDCPHRRCVCPWHLEPVTVGENTLRGNTLAAHKKAQTECIHGHPFDEPNTYRAKNGTRACRRCKADSMVRDRAKKRGVSCVSA